MHAMPGPALNQLATMRLRLMTAAAGAMSGNLDCCLDAAAVPTRPAQYPPKTDSYNHDSSKPGAGSPLERASVKVVLNSVRLGAATKLKADPALDADGMQRLLSNGCASLAPLLADEAVAP